jgi:hypothetical protein
VLVCFAIAPRKICSSGSFDNFVQYSAIRTMTAITKIRSIAVSSKGSMFIQFSHLVLLSI